MDIQTPGPVELIYAVARGDAPWPRWAALGVHVSSGPDAFVFEARTDIPIVAVSAADVARGLLARKIAGDLQIWAKVLLAALFVDLRALDESADGRVILDTLWDAAAGRDPDARSLRAAENLVATGN